jgi:C-terminal processing protease CtpA/Prc
VSDHQASLTGQSPIVILVNQYTTSAAQAFAAAFQAVGRAYIIGDKTPGSVKASEQYELAGGALSITTGRIFVGTKRVDLDGRGVIPDRIVPLTQESVAKAKVLGISRFLFTDNTSTNPRRTGYDSQVQAALDYLLSGNR